MRRLIIITAVAFGVLAVVGLGILFAWRKSRETSEQAAFPLAPTSSVSFPTAPPFAAGSRPSGQEITPSKLRALSDQPAFGYWIGSGFIATSSERTYDLEASEQVNIFYFNETGQIFKIKESADDEIISSEPISKLRSVQASRDGKWIVIESGSQTSPRFRLFNAETGIWQMLPENIMAAAFSPDSQKIAYLDIFGNLIAKDLTGSKPKTSKILSINQKDFELKWLAADQILLISRPSSQIEGEIWAVNVKNKTLKLIASGRGLTVNWADDASWGLKFSIDAERQPRLHLIDKDGNLKAEIEFSTLPNKCLATLSALYCAVPQSYTVKKPSLPDDYLKKAAYSNDVIYWIGISQNASEIIYSPGEAAIDAVNFSFFNNALFFINRYDKKLYSLSL